MNDFVPLGDQGILDNYIRSVYVHNAIFDQEIEKVHNVLSEQVRSMGGNAPRNVLRTIDPYSGNFFDLSCFGALAVYPLVVRRFLVLLF